MEGGWRGEGVTTPVCVQRVCPCYLFYALPRLPSFCPLSSPRPPRVLCRRALPDPLPPKMQALLVCLGRHTLRARVPPRKESRAEELMQPALLDARVCSERCHLRAAVGEGPMDVGSGDPIRHQISYSKSLMTRITQHVNKLAPSAYSDPKDLI